jgi:hypothetical protein
VVGTAGACGARQVMHVPGKALALRGRGVAIIRTDVRISCSVAMADLASQVLPVCGQHKKWALENDGRKVLRYLQEVLW